MHSNGIPIEEWNRLNGFDDGYGYFVDLDGNPLVRTPASHPYSCDAYVVHKSEEFTESDQWVYSDRMLQWDRDTFTKAVRETCPNKTGSQSFFGRTPRDVNRFLNLYFGKEVKLTAVIQGCNVSTGYPYWIFAYKEV